MSVRCCGNSCVCPKVAHTSINTPIYTGGTHKHSSNTHHGSIRVANALARAVRTLAAIVRFDGHLEPHALLAPQLRHDCTDRHRENNSKSGAHTLLKSVKAAGRGNDRKYGTPERAQARAPQPPPLTDQQVHTLRQVFVVQGDQLLAVHLQRCDVQQHTLGDVAVLVTGPRDLVDGRVDLVRTVRVNERIRLERACRDLWFC